MTLEYFNLWHDIIVISTSVKIRLSIPLNTHAHTLFVICFRFVNNLPTRRHGVLLPSRKNVFIFLLFLKHFRNLLSTANHKTQYNVDAMKLLISFLSFTVSEIKIR